jgi:hypothetical protein
MVRPTTTRAKDAVRTESSRPLVILLSLGSLRHRCRPDRSPNTMQYSLLDNGMFIQSHFRPIETA